MVRLISVILAVSFACSATLSAGERVVVVELYTSQGCSSCPPADALLGELTERDDVIPLALHVDYWDYIGWKDEFANPAHTKRQKGYAYAAGQRTIYTPQMIVGGKDHVVGYKPMQLAKLMQAHLDAGMAFEISLTRQGDQVQIEIPATDGVGELAMHMFRYAPTATIEIRRGENAGRTLTYHNIVTAWQPMGTWDGSEDFLGTIDAAGEDAVVVLLQRASHGPILSAARLR